MPLSLHPIIRAHSGLDAISFLPDVRVSVEWDKTVTITIAGQKQFLAVRQYSTELFEDVMLRGIEDFHAWLDKNEDEYHALKREFA